MSPVHADEILKDLRRTHAQLKASEKLGLEGPSGEGRVRAWSMRLTLEEVDVLLAIVDERDDLKRRLVGDWEPGIDDEPGIRIVCNEPESGVHRGLRARRCDLDAGHEGDHRFPKTSEEAGARVADRLAPKRRPRFTYAEGCPRRDTIHDCPLGGCADASPRESEIPDVPQCPWYRQVAPNMRSRCKLTHGHDGDHERFGKTWTQAEAVTAFGHTPEGRESRETPPPYANGNIACSVVPSVADEGLYPLNRLHCLSTANHDEHIWGDGRRRVLCPGFDSGTRLSSIFDEDPTA